MFVVISHLRVFFDFLSLFGINTFSPGRSPRTQLNWKIWSFLLFLGQIAILLATMLYRDYFLRSDLSPVGMLLNMVHYTCMMSTTCSVIILSITSERQQLEYWQQLEKLRELRFQEELQDTLFYQRLARKFFLIVSVMLSLNGFVFYLIAYDPQWTIYVLVGISSIVINRMFCLKVLVFLEGLYCELLAFERCLQLFVDSVGVKEVHIIMVFDWHVAIIDIARRFHRLFEFSLFAIFLDAFIMLGVTFYWTYIHLICMNHVFSAATLFMVCAILLSMLFAVLNSCQSICETHKRCTRLAGLLEGSGFDSDLGSKINFLILKMQSEPLELSVMGFFKLDLTLFAELLATLPSYMIIYSQFLE